MGLRRNLGAFPARIGVRIASATAEAESLIRRHLELLIHFNHPHLNDALINCVNLLMEMRDTQAQVGEEIENLLKTSRSLKRQ